MTLRQDYRDGIIKSQSPIAKATLVVYNVVIDRKAIYNHNLYVEK